MLPLFSADDHIIEHPRVWSDRLPAKFQDAGPRLVEESGEEFWLIEGRRGVGPGQLSAGAKSNREKSLSNVEANLAKRFDEMLPGCYDPKERAKDMLSNGVVASVCFPSLPRFAGVLFLGFEDKELADLCIKAYNDFVIEEWCTGGPAGMFVPMSIVQLWDPVAAASEIRRCAALGTRALSMPENTVPLGLPSYYTDHWDPIWDACEEANVVVCLHIGTSGQAPAPTPEAPEAVATTLLPGIGSQTALVNLLFSPVCRKFPSLQFVLSESGMGWVSFAVERADLVWERYERLQGLDVEPPSAIWKRNMHVCQVEERVGLKTLDVVGANKVLWELDYPHPDTVWPHAQREVQRLADLADLSDEKLAMVTHTNAEALFRWTPATLDVEE